MTGLRGVLFSGVLLVIAGAAAAQGMTLPAYERVELDNGVVLVLSEKHDVPLIGIEALMRGGAVADPPGLDGVAALLAGLLEKGAGDRDAAAFAEAVAAVGGRLAARGGLEAITVSGEFMARDADLMVELVADLLRRPRLQRAEFDKLRERHINLLRAAKDSSVLSLLDDYGNAFLFGDHPYGRPVGGSEASLGRTGLTEVRNYYRDHFGADRLVIAVSGDFESAAMAARLTSAFGDWEPAPAALPVVSAPAPQPGPRVLLVDNPGSAQAYFWLGAPGVAMDYPGRAALDLANTLFGGRFTSMLSTVLRIESGLTYDARSSLLRPSLPGALSMTSFTAAETTVEAIDLTLGVLQRLHASPPGEELLTSARNYVLGQFPTDFETARQVASILARIEFYGVGRDYVDAYGAAVAGVDAAALAAVVAEVFPSVDELVYVVVGDAARLRDAVAKYGPVQEIPITAPVFRP